MLVVIITLLQYPLLAQNYLSEPYSNSHKLKKAVKTIDAPFTEEERNWPHERYIPPARPDERGETIYAWSSTRTVNWDLKTLCKPERVKGGKVWRVKIQSKGAKGIGIYLIADMPKGASLFVYDAKQTRMHCKIAQIGTDTTKGRYLHINKGLLHDKSPINQSGYISKDGLPIEQLRGDEIIIEYFEPKKKDHSGQIIINYLSHQYAEFGVGYNDTPNDELRSADDMACGTQSCSKSIACACNICSFLPAAVHKDTLSRSVVKIDFLRK